MTLVFTPLILLSLITTLLPYTTLFRSEPDLNLPDEDLLQRGHLLLSQLQGAGGGVVLELGDAGGGRDLGAHPVQGEDVGEGQRAHLHLPLLGQLAEAAHGGELLLADPGERALVEQIGRASCRERGWRRG